MQGLVKNKVSLVTGGGSGIEGAAVASFVTGVAMPVDGGQILY